MELNEARQKIDHINHEMLRLLEERMQLSREVAEYKQAHNMEIFVPAREVAILNEMRTAASPGMEDYVTAFFNALLQISRDYQADILSRSRENLAIPAEIRTEHLLLKPLDQTAAPALFSLTSDPEITHFMRFQTHTEISQTTDAIQDWTSGGNLSYIVLKQTGEFVGLFTFQTSSEKPRTVVLRVFLGKPFWGKGYCGELLRMAKDFAHNFLQAEQLQAYVLSQNIASCRALENAGFSLEQQFSYPDLDGFLFLYTYFLTE
ncbi:MAG: GNAT family N-acetyltransferase [Candidatus Merdivicinus sp.]|jgi:ribosomal-protein-alanine N-acetyltransferase